MKELIKSISKKEWRFVIIMVVVVILITSLPYLIGYLSAPQGTVYNGLHALSPGDIPVYYSYINQVKEGEIFVKDLFTSEEQTLGTFNVWWTIVGLTARVFNLPVAFAFQLFRILMIPIFIFFVYLFISYFFTKEIKRKVCLVLLLFSSGLGPYFAFVPNLNDSGWTEIYHWPIDLWITESNTFSILYQTSHFIASITLTIVIFLLMILAFEKRKLNYAVVSGFLALLYFNFHPYYLPVIFGVLGLYLLILMIKAGKFLWQESGYLILVFLISLPSVIYHMWLIKSSPVIGFRALQNVTYISPIIFILIGYGFLWLGFILGLWFLLKNKVLNKKFIFLLSWLAVNLALIYLPVPFQRRYTQGLHIILVIFTTIGLFNLYYYLKTKLKVKIFDFWVDNPFLWIMLSLLFLLPSTLFNLTRDIYHFRSQIEEVGIFYYIPEDIFKAFEWLNGESYDKIVLAAEIPAKFLPSVSRQHVYYAHGHETLFVKPKSVEVKWFYWNNEDDESKQRFLEKQKISYVFYSDYEKKLGIFNPANKDYLELVFDLPKAQVYQVIRN